MGSTFNSFAAVDFETATSLRDSACAVGVAVFDNGELVAAEKRLIRPPGNAYDPFNEAIHGIGPEDTADAPPFSAVWPEMADLIGDRVVVAHNTSFDMSVLRHSAEQCGYMPPSIRFACSYRLAKRTFPDRWSYSLKNLSLDLGVNLKDHHDPRADAIAAGEVMLAVLRENGLESIDQLPEALPGMSFGRLASGDWTAHSTSHKSTRGRRKGRGPTESMASRMKALESDGSADEDSPLFGARVVFTGTLTHMTRIEAAQIAKDAGATPADNMSTKVDFLVVGETNYAVVGSDGMSSKLRKAVKIAESGNPLEIIDERAFLQMAGTAPAPQSAK